LWCGIAAPRETAKGGAQMKITVKKVEKVEATTQGTGPAA
jgi:hypothetical protein